MAEGNKDETEFDIFVVNTVYPEAESIFTARIKPLEELKDDAFIVLDTNALLVPYSIGKESLEQIRCTYKGLVASQRLIVPGQVAREFAQHRASKISELFQQLNRKKNIPGLQKGQYPLLESVDAYKEAIRLEKEIDELLGKYRETIDRVLDHIREWAWNDPVSSMYAELFGSGVVLDLELDKEKVREELLWRQTHQIPPGYKDAGKEDQGIGDLLIWHTILEVGRSKGRSVIFVSGDQKADWWHRSEGQALYPRYELVDEFRRHSDGHSFQIVQFSRFLDLYGASESIVQEVRQEEVKRRIELELIGEFIRKWTVLEQNLLSWYRSIHPDASPRWMPAYRVSRMLFEEGIIASDLSGLIKDLNDFRNRLIHEPVDFSAEQIRERIRRLDAVLVRMPVGYRG
jgi:uncharacterized protein YutE (UPF0331/DUF86 family)